jgi:hypothetical protein
MAALPEYEGAHGNIDNGDSLLQGDYFTDDCPGCQEQFRCCRVGPAHPTHPYSFCDDCMQGGKGISVKGAWLAKMERSPTGDPLMDLCEPCPVTRCAHKKESHACMMPCRAKGGTCACPNASVLSGPSFRQCGCASEDDLADGFAVYTRELLASMRAWLRKNQ